jgi:hypothetical protein
LSKNGELAAGRRTLLDHWTTTDDNRPPQTHINQPTKRKLPVAAQQLIDHGHTLQLPCVWPENF